MRGTLFNKDVADAPFLLDWYKRLGLASRFQRGRDTVQDIVQYRPALPCMPSPNCIRCLATPSESIVGPCVEMHALEIADPSNQHIARVADDGGPEAAYRCVCVLAG